MTIPVRTAVCGAAVHEALAKTPEEAWKKVEQGEIIVDSAQNYNCGCSAAMATSASMPVIVCEDPVYGGIGYAPIHPGNSPRVLRWGYYDEKIEQHLEWFRDVYSVALDQAVKSAGGIDAVNVLAKTAGMGDENHNRLFASSMYLDLELIAHLAQVESLERDAVIRELAVNDRFFLHVLMAAAERCDSGGKKSALFDSDGGYGRKRRGIRHSGGGDRKSMVYRQSASHFGKLFEPYLYSGRYAWLSGRQLRDRSIRSGLYGGGFLTAYVAYDRWDIRGRQGKDEPLQERFLWLSTASIRFPGMILKVLRWELT